ncbi:unnamed protein product [Rotaria magnacalcarata]|uniref:Uncharacterized protein n=1 Tax=Rotaria magnacalcarata TaxID=392030 RepID=A0A816ZUH3_9BILA|nr:unnamed protein product [Rotaria magnacalcarata]CAF1303641.1 unnamed protein product [Rotaria magnacalcarata]CAF2143019.1 unnamed protein product [Rotaria magnacalcarata]CAF2211883.1 unnamed protein product [Rotaria magnacalcarata]CAF2220563.1 unnamed protein product [Rotaria magnacalcarata]
MTINDNTTKIFIEQSPTESSYDTYNDNKDIIWPTAVGIFVTLALGWMICRYKCSSKERSPHSVRCCPKSLCKNIRLCFMYIFGLKHDQQQDLNSQIPMNSNKARTSAYSLQEIPFLIDRSSINRSSFSQVHQQWPPPFVLDQLPSFPLSITVQPTITSSQPKRHPLRRDSTLHELHNERRESSLWPFRTINAVFHKQTSEIKENDLFLSS